VRFNSDDEAAPSTVSAELDAREALPGSGMKGGTLGFCGAPGMSCNNRRKRGCYEKVAISTEHMSMPHDGKSTEDHLARPDKNALGPVEVSREIFTRDVPDPHSPDSCDESPSLTRVVVSPPSAAP